MTIDQLYPRLLCDRKAVSVAGTKGGAAAFRLGAAAITFIFSFLGFLVSRLPLCWPFDMSTPLGSRTAQIERLMENTSPEFIGRLQALTREN